MERWIGFIAGIITITCFIFGFSSVKDIGKPTTVEETTKTAYAQKATEVSAADSTSQKENIALDVDTANNINNYLGAWSGYFINPSGVMDLTIDIKKIEQNSKG